MISPPKQNPIFSSSHASLQVSLSGLCPRKRVINPPTTLFQNLSLKTEIFATPYYLYLLSKKDSVGNKTTYSVVNEMHILTGYFMTFFKELATGGT